MYEFKVGDIVHVKGGLRLTIDVEEAEITEIEEKGFYRLSISPMSLTADSLELISPVDDSEDEELPEGFIGKAVCVSEYIAPRFTLGKVYEFENGMTYDDDGDARFLYGLAEEDLRLYGFLAIVE